MQIDAPILILKNWEQFQTVFTTVIAFYFGTQYQKNSAEINEEGN
jgi:hypothetical protein